MTSGLNAPLALHDITKKFGSITALEDVSLSVNSGKITALLGENGAGKTTLMRIAFGMIPPDSGSITVDGRRARFNSPADAIAAGIGMVHQQFSLIPAMTVAENVALGGRGRFSLEQTSNRLAEIARSTGLELDPRVRVAALSSAERQKLEIIRTLAHRAKVMILDEPTAVLTSKDTAELFNQLKTFTASGGAVVLITHKLRDALEHADEVTVLRRGHVVLSSSMSIATETSLVTAMLGSTPAASLSNKPTPVTTTSILASLEHVLVPEKRSAEPIEVSLEIMAGEVLGLAALDGAAAPLLRILARRIIASSGTVALPDKIGFVPENRREEALISDFSLVENVALAGAGLRTGRLDWREIQTDTQSVISAFDVRVPDIDTSPDKLSGGNQQRFVLGRELREAPSLLVLENPTQGLDVNAAAFVHEQMRQARSDGASIVFYSSDLDELAELSDRVLVISGRRVVHVAADRDVIGRALLSSEVR